jgi:cell division septation protein DedD
LVLESRHLIGLFLLMVVISGVVFTLGYLMGRNQADAQFRAAAKGMAPPPAPDEAAAKTPAAQAPASQGQKQPSGTGAASAPSEWDFYRSGEKAKKQPEPQKPRAAVDVASKQPGAAPSASGSEAAANPPGKSPGQMNAPLVPRGSMVLQVAAVTKEGDALAMAEELQQKKYPAFVLPPSNDKYYRVQVGPYSDVHMAETTRHKLQQQGFKTIVKR